MTNSGDSLMRVRALQLVVLLVFAVIGIRLIYVQLIDDRYDDLASNNYIRYVTEYPPRGEVFDRNGEYLVQNRVCYDLMAVYRDMPKSGVDTTLLSSVTGLSHEKLSRAFRKVKESPRKGVPVAKYLTVEQKIRLDEMNIPGFYTVPRTARQYPAKIGGNVLGSLAEVSARVIERDDYYAVGDYYGETGVEAAFEQVLRGEKGVIRRDIYAHNSESDSVMVKAAPGKSIVCTIDAKLQQFAEELMAGKIGSVVAIEPSTGEILAMASSPTFDPDELSLSTGRGNHYMELLNNPRRPLFNRSVMSPQPPGSTFKLVNGLIGLQEGVLRPHYTYPCHKGYHYGKGQHERKLGCHEHRSPADLRYAVSTSCNAYFCYVFSNILRNRSYDSKADALDAWYDYVLSFGFGRKLDTDFLGEKSGFVPTREFIGKKFWKWNEETLLSLSIGQGDLLCTPLQLANLAAIVANRGYYYIPHIVRNIEGQDSLDARFYKRNYTKVDPKHFDVIVDGMYRCVNVDGTGVYWGHVKGLDICGKTGTAQNPRGDDHATFISFAPRNNPRIAIAVYVEHGVWGGTTAVPIATLLEEFYLTGEVSRPEIVEYVKSLKFDYSKIDHGKKKR